jgi:hypothetical protein
VLPDLVAVDHVADSKANLVLSLEPAHGSLRGQSDLLELLLRRLEDPIPVVPVLGESAVGPRVVARGDVVENEGPLLEVLPRELPLDPILALEEPVHGFVERSLALDLDPKLGSRGRSGARVAFHLLFASRKRGASTRVKSTTSSPVMVLMSW